MAVSKFTNSSSANDFNLNIGSTYSVVTLTQEYPAGAYSFTSVANDTTMDLYFYNAQGYVCYTNTKGVIAPTGFNKIVVIGGTVGDVLSFSYKTTFTTVAETSEITAGPVILSVTPTSLPNVNSSTTVTGLNFATDITATFTGTDSLVRNAKSVVRGSATSLVITRPDNMPVAYAPYALTVTNPSIAYQPIGSNSHIISVTSGVVPIWVTSGTQSAAYAGQSYSVTISATDADGGSSVTYSVVSGSLPSGTTLNSNTGVISGAVNGTAAGNYTATIRATDSGGNYADQSLTFPVNGLASTSANAVATAASLAAAGITQDGEYYLNFGGSTAYKVYCILSQKGGKWMRIANFQRGYLNNTNFYTLNVGSDFSLANNSGNFWYAPSNIGNSTGTNLDVMMRVVGGAASSTEPGNMYSSIWRGVPLNSVFDNPTSSGTFAGTNPAYSADGVTFTSYTGSGFFKANNQWNLVISNAGGAGGTNVGGYDSTQLSGAGFIFHGQTNTDGLDILYGYIENVGSVAGITNWTRGEMYVRVTGS
jgi:hypothetical protein